MIETHRPYTLFATCSVVYEGRATSTLELGNYLVMRKADGSMSIHGSTLNTPRNYMGAGAECMMSDNVLVFTLKKETIKVKIENIISIMYLDGWSDKQIEITRTEKELAQKIHDRWVEYFGEGYTLEFEYPTEVGPIDLFGKPKDIFGKLPEIVVEVKRKQANLAAVSQLRRYVECIDTNKELIDSVRGCLASPSISPNALKFLRTLGPQYRWLQIDFDQTV